MTDIISLFSVLTRHDYMILLHLYTLLLSDIP